MDELKKTGEICFGPLAARKFEGQKDFDKYYIDREIKQVAKKIGPGEEDYIIVDKVVETKRDIDKVIQAQASDVGIEAYLKTYEKIGEPIPDVVVEDDIQDFTNMPKSLADACLLGEDARKKYASLPKELRGRKTFEEFMTSFTNDMLDSYIKSLIPKEEKKDEVVK